MTDHNETRNDIKRGLAKVIEEKGLTFQELAVRTNTTGLAVKRVLDLDYGSTLWQMARLAEAVGYEIVLREIPRKE